MKNISRFIKGSFFIIAICAYSMGFAQDKSLELIPQSALSNMTFPQPKSFLSDELALTQTAELGALQAYDTVTTKALPSALSYLTASMNTPYVLLIASAGVSMAYVMLNPSASRVQDFNMLIGASQSRMLTIAETAVGGLAYGMAYQSTKGAHVINNLYSYMQPIMLTGIAAGLVLMNTSILPINNPYLFSAMNNILLGALPNLLTGGVIEVAKQKMLKYVSSHTKKVIAAPKDTHHILKNKHKRNKWETRLRTAYNNVSTNHLIALITFGSIITLQVTQAGELSDQDKALTMATLVSATQLIQNAVTTEYAIRLGKNVCQRVAEGASKAFNFGARFFNTCKTTLSSFISSSE